VWGEGYFFEDTLFLGLGEVAGVPFGEARSAVATDQEKAMNHLDIFLNYQDLLQY
jgi:hypothetical protein